MFHKYYWVVLLRIQSILVSLPDVLDVALPQILVPASLAKWQYWDCPGQEEGGGQVEAEEL